MLRRKRQYENKAPKAPRNEYQHDRDRIIYSAGFRRLGGITQVAATAELQLLHTRLTHSLKVGQVARRLTEGLRHRLAADYQSLIDPDVAETAGLAHDIGHPPFGHSVEEKLNELLSEQGGFDGNAQTIRYATKTARRSIAEDQDRWGSGALDLTRASIRSLLKYPRLKRDPVVRPLVPWHDRHYAPKLRPSDPISAAKWNVYPTEADVLAFALVPGDQRRSIEASLMDWADDISYAVHDVEDYIKSGLMPMQMSPATADNLMTEIWSALGAPPRGRYSNADFLREEFDSAAAAVFAWWTSSEAPDRYTGTRSDENRINRWVTGRITDYLSSVEIAEDASALSIPSDLQYQVEILKYLTVLYVINAPPFAAAQHGQRKVIEEVFSELLAILVYRSGSAPRGLTEVRTALRIEQEASQFADANDTWVNYRSVCDYICTLTEAQTYALRERLRGLAPSMFHGPWL